MALRTAVQLTGDNLTIDDVWAVAVDRAPAALSGAAREKVVRARELVERAAHGTNEHTYGINTGFGRFVSRSIPEELAGELQLRLLRSHACGVGEPYPDEVVRAAMLLRANTLAKGTSGARIETERGAVELLLFPDEAPITVHNFVTLARRHYFDGQRFHRVVPNFVVQAGDPRGDGNGGPGYAIRDELNPRRYLRGTLGMALSGPNTGGSQFFVTHAPQPHLDGGYTVFGQLVTGGDVLDRIVQGDRIVRITIQ